MTLLLVDAANVLLRCAFGGDTPPEQSTPVAVGMIDRAIRETRASHLIVALDYPGAPSWRQLEYPDYKATRSRDTSPWLIAGASAFAARRWKCEVHAGFEADDLIATIALRAVHRTRVVILSGDSDLFTLTEHTRIDVVRPVTGGGFEGFGRSSVIERYEIPSPSHLVDFKAMVGETTDNVPGVPGIGAKRAALLTRKLGHLEDIIRAGEGGYNRDAERVARYADIARRAYRLVSLHCNAPVAPISLAKCRVWQ